jgi:hypothetical protein
VHTDDQLAARCREPRRPGEHRQSRIQPAAPARRCARGVPDVALRSSVPRRVRLCLAGRCRAPDDRWFRSESFCHCVDTVDCRPHGPMGGGHDAFRVGSHLPCRSRQAETPGQGRARQGRAPLPLPWLTAAGRQGTPTWRERKGGSCAYES